MTEKQIDIGIMKGKAILAKNLTYDLTGGEGVYLFQGKHPFDAVCDAYMLGIARGVRIAKKRYEELSRLQKKEGAKSE